MFNVHQEYDRNELLAFVGSKQGYSGIIWGSKETSCVIVTSGGKAGKSAGYDDSPNDDGTRYYIGQGGEGDQNHDSASNSLLANGERSILFFSTTEPTAKQVRERGNRRKRYKFEGIYEVGSWEYFIPQDGVRMNDKLLRFLLIPASNVFSIIVDSQDTESFQRASESDLHNLRSKLLREAGKPTKGRLSPREYIRRSKEIVEYAKQRAQGVCEYCKSKGPFLGCDFLPYLEVHHIFRLADDGPDLPCNVAALCPNCHKEAHFGLGKREMRDKLAEIILAWERELDAQQPYYYQMD
jgi:5-methylcytosine-specific restriction protein A